MVPRRPDHLRPHQFCYHDTLSNTLKAPASSGAASTTLSTSLPLPAADECLPKYEMPITPTPNADTLLATLAGLGPLRILHFNDPAGDDIVILPMEGPPFTGKTINATGRPVFSGKTLIEALTAAHQATFNQDGRL